MVTERSLSINARVITSDRSALGKVTVRGLRAGTEAVRFNDPVSGQPANIASTKKKQSVWSAYDAYKARLEKEKQEDGKKEAKKYKKLKRRYLNPDSPFQKCEDALMNEEEVVRADLKAAGELLSDTTSKLYDSLSATTVN